MRLSQFEIDESEYISDVQENGALKRINEQIFDNNESHSHMIRKFLKYFLQYPI